MSAERDVVSLVNISRQKWPPRFRSYFGSLVVQTPEEGQVFAITPIRGCKSIVDMGDQRSDGFHDYRPRDRGGPGEGIERRLGGRKFPRSVCGGRNEPSAEELKRSAQKLEGFIARLVEIADLEWERSHNPMFITDLERRAARELKLDKAMGVRPETTSGMPGVRRKDQTGSGGMQVVPGDTRSGKSGEVWIGWNGRKDGTGWGDGEECTEVKG